VSDYWVYENWRARGHQARVHEGNCPSCNNGEGLRGRGTHPDNGRWHGPFPSFEEANDFASAHSRAPSCCRRCEPQNG